MTIVVIPPVRDGSGIPMPARVNVRLVGSDAQNRAQLASEKGMEIMPWDTVEALRASMLIGDECDALNSGNLE